MYQLNPGIATCLACLVILIFGVLKITRSITLLRINNIEEGETVSMNKQESAILRALKFVQIL